MTKLNKAISPNNPSRAAIGRVLNPLPIPKVCHHCGSEVAMSSNEAIYGKPIGQWPWAYLCQNKECHSYVGMHPFTNIPLGTLADAHTREARKISKALFEQIYGNARQMTRTEAYEWLARQLDIPISQCHFAWFDVATCRRAYRVLEDYLKKE